jgi:hypothetical protein
MDSSAGQVTGALDVLTRLAFPGVGEGSALRPWALGVVCSSGWVPNLKMSNWSVSCYWFWEHMGLRSGVGRSALRLIDSEGN